MGQARLAFRRLGGPAEPHFMVSVFRCTVPSASSGPAAAWTVLRFDLLAVLGSQQQHRRRALATWAKQSLVKQSQKNKKVNISKPTSIHQPVASFFPPPWCYSPPPQPVLNPQRRPSSSSDSDSGSSGGGISSSSREVKKQEKQLHRGASLVMKLPKACFRPAHVWPGHDTPGVTLRGPATSTRSSWELAWNGAMWVG